MKALWDKIKNWLNTNNHLIWIATIALIALGLLGVYFIGPYQATRLKLGPDIFFNKYWPVTLIGIVIIFAFSKLSKKWVVRISWLLGIFSTLLLLKIWIMPTVVLGSARIVKLGFMHIDPFMLMLPAYIVLMSHWLSKKLTKPILSVFGMVLLTLFIIFTAIMAPYTFMAQIYSIIFILLTFKARKNIPELSKVYIIALVMFGMCFLVQLTFPHVQARLSHIFSAPEKYTQAWYSIAAIRHSVLIGNTSESLNALSILPESYTDFMLTGMIARFGILMGLLIIALYVCLVKGLAGTIRNSSDSFNKLLATGTLGLLAILITSGLAVTFGLLFAMAYWPFISFGGVAFLAWSILLGFILAVNRN